jgi:hypothetical protein
MLTLDELAVNFETGNHILDVKKILQFVIYLVSVRAADHDRTKMNHPEVEVFSELSEQLNDLTYGSAAYHQQRLDGLAPALKYHYAANRHHPEYFKDGINDMNLIDIVEMLADWMASARRHADGDILKSIAHNRNRFGMGAQLTQLLLNSVPVFEKAIDDTPF